MIVYVHAYDIGHDRGMTWDRHAGATDVRHVLLEAGDSMSIIVERIIAAVRTEASIYTMLINAHGLVEPRGRGTVSRGMVSLSDAANLSDLTAPAWRPLRPYFTRRTGVRGVEIHACRLLECERGGRMCQVLADTLQIQVTAADADQRGITPAWSATPSDEYGSFEGRARTFLPRPDPR